MSIFFKNFGPYSNLRTANWPIAWRKQSLPYNKASVPEQSTHWNTSSHCDNFCNFLVHSWLCGKVSLLRTLFLLYLLDVLNFCLNRLEDFAFKTELRVRPNKDKDIAVVKFWTTLKPTGRKFPLCKVHLNLSTQGIDRAVSFMYHFVFVPVSWNNL